MSSLLAGPDTLDEFRPARAPFRWLLEREVLRYLRIWRYSLLGPILSTLLFVLVFGTVLARQVGDFAGHTYGQFIVPGLVAQACVNVGYYNGTTSLYEARRDKYVNDVLAAPLRWWEVNLALVAAAMLRGVVTSAVILAVAVPLTGLRVDRPGYLAVAALGLLLLAAQLGVLVGALVNSLDHVYSVESLLLMPLGFLGGIFYSASMLPSPWGTATQLNPFFWLVQAVRHGFLGAADGNPAVALTVVWVLALGLSAASAWIFATGRRLKA